MMHAGMHWLFREHLLGDRIDRLPARQRDSMLRVVPELKHQKCFRFEIVGKLVAEILERADQVGPALFFILLCVR
jgi:hypothetical protein